MPWGFAGAGLFPPRAALLWSSGDGCLATRLQTQGQQGQGFNPAVGVGKTHFLFDEMVACGQRALEVVCLVGWIVLESVSQRSFHRSVPSCWNK